MRGRTYAQTALTFNLGHSRPHDDTSTEFHTETGPFTLVPLPQRRSSLVFVVDRAEVGNIATLSNAQLAAEIERRSHSVLGKVEVEGGRGVFPSAAATATRLARGGLNSSAKPPTSLRQSARKASTSGCVTPRPSASSWSPAIARARTSGS